MKTDRELLELAARAAGLDVVMTQPFIGLQIRNGNLWRPLDDDGDALRLAAALDLDLLIYHGYGEVLAESACGNHRGVAVFTENRADDYRHAIVRAAASIGEQMK
jgi:hypothetical protein